MSSSTGPLAGFLQKYKAASGLKARTEVLNEFAEIYHDSYQDEVNRILLDHLNECMRNNYADGEVVCRIFLFYGAFMNSNIPETEKHITRIEQLYSSIQESVIQAHALMFLGYMNAYRGNYDEAFSCMFRAADCYRDHEGHLYNGWSRYGLGILYTDIRDPENARKQLEGAEGHFRRQNFQYGIARTQTALATLDIHEGNYDRAEELLSSAASVYKEYDVLSGLSRTYNELSVIARKKGDTARAYELSLDALEMRRRIRHHQGVATSLNELGEICLEMKKTDEGIRFLEESVRLCASIGNKTKQYRAHYILSFLYKEKGELETALTNLLKYDELKSDVMSSQSGNRIRELEKKVASAEAEKKAELERIRNVELREAYLLIENKNKEILDSIQYARRIQVSLMPSEQGIARMMERSQLNGRQG